MYDNVTDLRTINDYRKLFTVKQQGILERERPAHIPQLDFEYFVHECNHRIIFLKIADNDYILYDKNAAYRMDLDLLVLTQDYYLKYAKELHKQKYKSKFTAINSKRFTYTQAMYILKKIASDNGKPLPQYEKHASYYRNASIKDRKACWEFFAQMMLDFNQKLDDLELDKLDAENTYSKGEITSYGDTGLSDTLYSQYGVKIKRQNGDRISAEETGELKNALDDVFHCFGNLSHYFREYGLKISHSADKRMHARKFIGLFYDYFKVIGVGDCDTAQTLAHEIAHFMDFYQGKHTIQKHRHASDHTGSTAHTIASIFRKNMNKKTESKYYNRTCECFARALEQYFEPKLAANDYYCKNTVFSDTIKPLITSFLETFHQITISSTESFPEQAITIAAAAAASVSIPSASQLTFKTIKTVEQLSLF